MELESTSQWPHEGVPTGPEHLCPCRAQAPEACDFTCVCSPVQWTPGAPQCMRESECVCVCEKVSVSVHVYNPSADSQGFLQCRSSRRIPEGRVRATVPIRLPSWERLGTPGPWLESQMLFGRREHFDFLTPSTPLWEQVSTGTNWCRGGLAGRPEAGALSAGHRCAHRPCPVFSAQPHRLTGRAQRFVCASRLTQPLGVKARS